MGYEAGIRPQTLVDYRHWLESQSQSKAMRQSQIQAHQPGKWTGGWGFIQFGGKHLVLVGSYLKLKQGKGSGQQPNSNSPYLLAPPVLGMVLSTSHTLLYCLSP